MYINYAINHQVWNTSQSIDISGFSTEDKLKSLLQGQLVEFFPARTGLNILVSEDQQSPLCCGLVYPVVCIIEPYEKFKEDVIAITLTIKRRWPPVKTNFWKFQAWRKEMISAKNAPHPTLPPFHRETLGTQDYQ